MTKMQKIWLWISGALFLIPEILWSPIANFYYQLSQTSRSGGTYPFRCNFLQNSDNLNYLKLVIFLQLLGVLFSLVFATQIDFFKKNKFIKYLLITLLVILLVLVGFAVLFTLTFNIDVM